MRYKVSEPRTEGGFTFADVHADDGGYAGRVVWVDESDTAAVMPRQIETLELIAVALEELVKLDSGKICPTVTLNEDDQ